MHISINYVSALMLSLKEIKNVMTAKIRMEKSKQNAKSVR
jgi:hypothetical protein